MKQVVVVGAGAMGSLFAARIAASSANVFVVEANRDRASLMARDGITVVDCGGESYARVSVRSPDAITEPIDLVLLFTKGAHSQAAIRSIAHIADGNCLGLTLQNGLGSAEILAGAFGESQTLVGVTDIPAGLTGPTRVESVGDGLIWLGGLNSASQARAGDAATLLRAAGFEASVHDDIRVPIWETVASNAALSALATILDARVGDLDVTPGYRIIASVIAEVKRTAEALGIAIDGAKILNRIRHALRDHRDYPPSMLRDRRAGLPTEIEFINGAVAREASRAEVDGPVISYVAPSLAVITCHP